MLSGAWTARCQVAPQAEPGTGVKILGGAHEPSRLLLSRRRTLRKSIVVVNWWHFTAIFTCLNLRVLQSLPLAVREGSRNLSDFQPGGGEEGGTDTQTLTLHRGRQHEALGAVEQQGPRVRGKANHFLQLTDSVNRCQCRSVSLQVFRSRSSCCKGKAAAAGPSRVSSSKVTELGPMKCHARTRPPSDTSAQGGN